MIEDCCCWLVDEVLDEGESRSMVVDEGEPTISTALGVAATRIGETSLCGGLKYSSNMDSESFLLNQRHEEMINPASSRVSAHMEFCCIRDGSGNGFGYNKLY
ncbi:hypothetical protein Tco_1197293 [Tanacetum coccineum]